MQIHQYFKAYVAIYGAETAEMKEINGRYDFTKSEKEHFESVKREIDLKLLKNSDCLDWNVLSVIYAKSALELRNYE